MRLLNWLRPSSSLKWDRIICSFWKTKPGFSGMWFDASYVTANIKNVASEFMQKPRKLKHFVRPKEPKENLVPKEHQNIYLRETVSINGVESERSTTRDSHQLGHDANLRNTRFNVKKDVCMLKTHKGPAPPLPRAHLNPPKIHAIYTVSTRRS